MQWVISFGTGAFHYMFGVFVLKAQRSNIISPLTLKLEWRNFQPQPQLQQIDLWFPEVVVVFFKYIFGNSYQTAEWAACNDTMMISAGRLRETVNNSFKIFFYLEISACLYIIWYILSCQSFDLNVDEIYKISSVLINAYVHYVTVICMNITTAAHQNKWFRVYFMITYICLVCLFE